MPIQVYEIRPGFGYIEGDTDFVLYTPLPPQDGDAARLYQKWLKDGGVVKPAPVPALGDYELTKLQVIDRMSDTQLDEFFQALSGQSKRLQKSFELAQTLNSGHPMFKTLRAAMTQAWGKAEADRILARS